MDEPSLPTEFRGVMFDDGWEFDAPCVVYSPRPMRRFRVAGNSGGIDALVEDICCDITCGLELGDGGLERECEWRRWSLRGFAKRKRAWHVVITGRWARRDGELEFEPTGRVETYGPPVLADTGGGEGNDA